MLMLVVFGLVLADSGVMMLQLKARGEWSSLEDEMLAAGTLQQLKARAGAALADGTLDEAQQSSVDIVAYWDKKSCGPKGNDFNWALCGKKAFKCPETLSNRQECGGGDAKLITTHGTGKKNSYKRGQCSFWYFAEYACVGTDGSEAASDSTDQPIADPVTEEPTNSASTTWQSKSKQVCNGAAYTAKSGPKNKRCDGWRGLSKEQCQQKCEENAQARNCPQSTCVAAAFYPKKGWCHLYDKCDGLKGRGSANLMIKPTAEDTAEVEETETEAETETAAETETEDETETEAEGDDEDGEAEEGTSGEGENGDEEDTVGSEADFKLVKRDAECKSKDANVGSFDTVLACAAAVQKAGGEYFIYGKGKKAGRCYLEKTSDGTCSEGFKSNAYDFYAVNGDADDAGDAEGGAATETEDSGTTDSTDSGAAETSPPTPAPAPPKPNPNCKKGWKAQKNTAFARLNKGFGAHVKEMKKAMQSHGNIPFTCLPSKGKWCHVGSGDLVTSNGATTYTWDCL